MSNFDTEKMLNELSSVRSDIARAEKMLSSAINQSETSFKARIELCEAKNTNNIFMLMGTIMLICWSVALIALLKSNH